MKHRFPHPYTVKLKSLITDGSHLDEMGQRIEEFADPVEHRIMSWAPVNSAVSDALRDLGTGVKRDLDVYTQYKFGKPRDLVEVPGAGLFEIVGYPEDYNFGPFNGPGGYRLNLQRVEG